MNSFFSPLSPMKQSRRFQNQQQFAPVITQQPVASDQQYSQPVNQQYSQPVNQQYSQPVNQQSQSSVFQGPSQGTMLRVLQSSPSRLVNMMNAQPTSSSYRR